MAHRAYKSSIPAEAAEVIEERYSQGGKKSASYFLDGEKVGVRTWDEEGWLDYECGLRGEVRHGYEYRWVTADWLLECEPYRNGVMHGVGRQWGEDGRLLATWKLVHGRGLDLWCNGDGSLDAEMYFIGAGISHRRFWNPDGQTIHGEELWIDGPWTDGIHREWNTQGKLRRGFPRYYLRSARVTRRQYLQVCKANAALPIYRPEDDLPAPTLPAEYLAQRKKRQRL